MSLFYRLTNGGVIMKQVWVMLVIVALPMALAASDTVDRLRVLQTTDDTFDYTFTTYTPTSDGQWTLAFNHRYGQTVFARMGETVGPYRIGAFEPDEKQRFNPALKATSRQKAGWVTLVAPDGTSFRLALDQPLLLSGQQRAALVAVPSGRTWNVRTGDRLRMDGTDLTVSVISNVVRVINTTTSASSAIPDLKPSDVEQLRAEHQRREQLTRIARSPGFPQPDVPAPTARLVPASHPAVDYVGAIHNLPNQATTAGAYDFVYSTEYRYPVAYDVIVFRQADRTWQPVCLPRRFETFRSNNFGSSRHDVSRRLYHHSQGQQRLRPLSANPASFLRIPHPDAQRQQYAPRQ